MQDPQDRVREFVETVNNDSGVIAEAYIHGTTYTLTEDDLLEVLKELEWYQAREGVERGDD